MAYRGLLCMCRDFTARTVHGNSSVAVPNATKDLGLRPSPQTAKLKCAWKRFEDTHTGCKLKEWCRKLNDHLNIIALLFAKQCNAIAAQRIRRGAQIMNLYSRIYDKQTVGKIVEHCTRNSSQRKSLSLLLSAVLFSWDQHKITESEIDFAVEELTSLRASDLPPKEQLAHNLGGEWERVINRDHLAAWRKPIPNSYLYEYKVYGTYSDIPARAFFNVQTDLEYRKQWDKLIIHLEIIDKQEQPGSEVIRWVTHFPYPMYSREYVFIRKYKVDYEKKVMVFMSQSTNHPACPEVAKYVRVHQYKSNFIIRPHSNFDQNGFDYVLTYYDDPQAAIPSAAIKWMAATGVPDFVDKLHTAAKRLHEASQGVEDENDTEGGKLAM